MSYAMDNRTAKGTALYTRKLIENLLNDPQNPFDYTLVHFEKVDDPLYAKAAAEIIMPKIKLPLPYGSRFISQMLFFWRYRKQKFDAIHWFQPRVYPFFWLAPARHIFITAHGAGDITAPSFFSLSRHIYNTVLKLWHKKADVLIAVSKFAQEEIITHYGALRERVRVVYNGGGEDFHRIDKKNSTERVGQKYAIRAPYILNVSRLQPHKNVNTVVRAYIQMREHNPDRKEQLVVVGTPVFGFEETYEIAKRSPFSDSITFISYIDKEYLNDLYCASELFVFPSLNEGFGLPVIEAMASGVPVITSNVTSLPEVSGDAALIFDPFDCEGISKAMNAILSNPSYRTSLVEKGLKNAQRFTWKQCAQDTISIYKDILNKR